MDVSATLATLYMALPYVVVTVAMWGTAAACVAAVRIRVRPPYVLLLAAGCTLLGTAMLLMAITAGPNSHVGRAAVALPIRALHLVAGVLWLAWLVAFLRGSVVVVRR